MGIDGFVLKIMFKRALILKLLLLATCAKRGFVFVN